MIDNELLERFYAQIETELEFCNYLELPFVCRQYADLETRAEIVKVIATTSINMHVSISQAIAQVERTYSVNSLD